MCARVLLSDRLADSKTKSFPDAAPVGPEEARRDPLTTSVPPPTAWAWKRFVSGPWHFLMLSSAHFRFIAEEAAAAGAKCVLTPSPTWIVDPIDGTCNFVHR